MTPDLLKYQRTRHLGDSALQSGDDGSDRVDFRGLEGLTVVYEEKLDGGNSGFRFGGDGKLMIQSRGRYLDALDRNARGERDWVMLKDWLHAHQDEFLERFEDRYLVYGEWMGIMHTVAYDALPSLFMEFDIYDLQRGCFLDTPSRHLLCAGLPIHSVPVLYHGVAQDLQHMKSLVGPSTFRAPGTWQHSLQRACALVGDDYLPRLAKTDGSDRMEGIYVKVERDGRTVDRMKWVRHDFVQAILSADEHWQSRFPVPNLMDRQWDVFPAYLAREPGPARDYDPMRPQAFAPWLGSVGQGANHQGIGPR